MHINVRKIPFSVIIVFAFAIPSLAHAGPFRLNCQRWEFCRDSQSCIIVQRNNKWPSPRSFVVDEERQFVQDHDFQFFLEFKDLGKWRSSVASPYFGAMRNADGKILFKTREPQRVILLNVSNAIDIPLELEPYGFNMRYDLEIEEIDRSGDPVSKFRENGYCNRTEIP